MTAPLEGVRVLDFTIMMAGPYATRLLADLGAEVVKIEPPEGDHIRGRPPLRDGASAYFGNLNCGKKSVCLDLREEEGRAIARALAERSDVLVENFRPGVMRRLGLAWEDLRQGNPALVYCSISGFGQGGAEAARPAYAPILHAASGYDLANLSYQDGLERPLQTGIFTADVLGGALAFGAINAALVRRGRDGKGEHIDLALMDAMLGLLVYECQEAQFEVGRRRPLYRPVKARDGFVIIAPVSQNNFEAMARTAGRPEWIVDPRFARPAEREHNWSLLMDQLDAWAAERTAEECERAMQEGGVPCSRYFTVREAMESDYARQRGAFTRVHDAAGTFKAANPAFRLANGAACARDWVASLGAHNVEVLGNILGRSSAEIAKLHADGILKQKGEES